MKVVLLYFMDGLRWDLARTHMPFLASLNARPLESEFGYSCACHATMYTGRPISEHGTWFVWERGDASPYAWLGRVPLLWRMDCLPVKAAAAKLTRHFHPNRAYPGIPILFNLPLKYWPLFQPSEDCFWTEEAYLPHWDTLFKLLRREGIRYRLAGLSKGGDPFREEALVDYHQDELAYFFLGEVDGVMHRCGSESPETAAYLKRVDDFIRVTYEKAIQARQQATVIAWSDHGHIDVKRSVDLEDRFKAQGLSLNRFIHLTESTFARFWFRDEAERRQAEGVMQSMEAEGLGYIMTRPMLERWNLPLETGRYGEIIFHLQAPNMFGKTIWGYGRKTVSMHGYDPCLAENLGVFASNLPLTAQRPVRLTDVLPSILHALGIQADESGFRGENVLEDAAP